MRSRMKYQSHGNGITNRASHTWRHCSSNISDLSAICACVPTSGPARFCKSISRLASQTNWTSLSVFSPRHCASSERKFHSDRQALNPKSRPTIIEAATPTNTDLSAFDGFFICAKGRTPTDSACWLAAQVAASVPTFSKVLSPSRTTPTSDRVGTQAKACAARAMD